MYNSYKQKHYSSSQNNPIYLDMELQKPNQEPSTHCDTLISGITNTITQNFMPLYEQFKPFLNNGRVLGNYSILTFPQSNQPKPPIKNLNTYSFSPEQQFSKGAMIQKKIVDEKRLHPKFIDQNMLQQILKRDLYDQNGYSINKPNDNGQTQAMKKLEKARKNYEKLSRQLKGNKKMKRRFKDKNRPKKAKSAYNLFVEDVVPQIKGENPSFSAPDLVRVAAKMYNRLTEQQKMPYQRRYLQDKQRFQRQREAYFNQNPEMDYRQNTKQKTPYGNKGNGYF